MMRLALMALLLAWVSTCKLVGTDIWQNDSTLESLKVTLVDDAYTFGYGYADTPTQNGKIYKVQISNGAKTLIGTTTTNGTNQATGVLRWVRGSLWVFASAFGGSTDPSFITQPTGAILTLGSGRCAKWNPGTSLWEALPGNPTFAGSYPHANDLDTNSNGIIAISGYFNTVNSVPANGIAIYNGSAWVVAGTAPATIAGSDLFSKRVQVSQADNSVYISSFTESTFNGVTGPGWKWNGGVLSTMPTSPNSQFIWNYKRVQCIGSDVYVVAIAKAGVSFDTASICKYNGTSLTELYSFTMTEGYMRTWNTTSTSPPHALGNYGANDIIVMPNWLNDPNKINTVAVASAIYGSYSGSQTNNETGLSALWNSGTSTKTKSYTFISGGLAGNASNYKGAVEPYWVSGKNTWYTQRLQAVGNVGPTISVPTGGVVINEDYVNGANATAGKVVTISDHDQFITGALQWNVPTPPAHGNVIFGAYSSAGYNVTYEPVLDYNGTDFFNVSVSDGQFTSNSVLINYQINAVNDAPRFSVADHTHFPMGVGTTRTFDLSATDPEGTAITYVLQASNNPSDLNGTVAANGQVTINVLPNATTGDKYCYIAATDETGLQRILNFWIYVAPNPTLTITPSSVITNANPIQFTFSFAVDVTGFDASDIQVSNGTKGAFAGSGNTYTMAVTPSANGAVSVSVPAGAATSLGFGVTTPSATATVTSDTSNPTGTLSPSGTTTNSSLVPYTLTLSEAYNGLLQGNIAVTNGSISGFSGSGTQYNFNVVPNDGIVTVIVAANTLFDSAGNGNLTISSSITVDRTRPNPTVTNANAKVNTSPFAAVIDFGEPIVGLTAADFTYGNGTVGTISGNGNIYQVQITPTAEGPVTLALTDSSYQDVAGNQGRPASASFEYDVTRPNIIIQGNGIFTNASPIVATILFSEPVIGFTASDINVTNSTKGTFSGSGSSYSIQLIPTANGEVVISIPDGAAADTSGNLTTAQSSTITFDTVTPTLAITPNGTTQAGTPVTATFTFSEPVVGFTANDLQVTNGSIGVMSGSGSVYTAPITPSSDGIVTLAVSASACADRAGNPIDNTNVTWTSDRTGPALVITPRSNATNASPIVFTFTFNEAVAGFDATKVTVTNGTKSAFAGSGSSYTLAVNPLSEGNVTVAVSAGACADLVGNLSIADTATVQFSNSNPTLVISAPSASFNSANTTLTFTFSTPVIGFTTSDITVTNATKGALSGTGLSYSLVITPVSEGAIGVSVPAAACTDSASNPNLAATATFAYDVSAPSLSITPTGITTNQNSFTFTLAFSEPVTGFTAGDVQVTNGSKGLFSGSGTTYLLTVTPTSDGSVIAEVLAGAATDVAGNQSTAASATVTSDRTKPSATITPNSGVTAASPINFNITFSENVTGLSASSFSVANGSVGSLTGSGSVYTLTVIPTIDGAISITIPANACLDANGNGSVGATASVTSDRTGPTVDITPSTQVTNSGPITFTFVFTEPVTGFTAADVTVSQGVKGSFTGSGTTYSLQVTPTAEGTVSVSVANGAGFDAAGNGSVLGSGSAIYDTTNPTVAIAPNSTTLNTSSIPFVITFSEPVTGFTNSDITVTGGSKTAFSGSGSSYTVAVNPNADGQVTVSISDGTCVDFASNSLIGGTASVTIDRSSPLLTITPNGTTSNAASIPFTFAFTEVVTGFSQSDIQVTNGTASAFTGSGSSYQATITPTAEGPVVVSVASGSCVDAVGIPNLTTSSTITSDKTGPIATITPASGSTKNSPIVFTVTLSETVTGLTSGDFIASNGTVGTLSGSGGLYAIQVSPSFDGPVTLTLGTSSCVDSAGNGNAASSATVTSDRTIPTVVIAPSGTSTSSASITYTLTFSENVTGLSLNSFTATNAAKQSITGSGTVYQVTVSALVDGAVTLQLLPNAAFDAAGNAAATATSTVTYDSTPPTLTVSAPQNTNASQVAVTFNFSEPVTGFTAADVGLTNANAGAFAVSGTTYTLQVAPTADGPVTITVADAVCVDLAGNSNTGNQGTFTSDRTPPTVNVTPTGTSSSATSITFTMTFSEAVTGLSASNILVTNGSKGSFSGGGTTYTMDVFPTVDGNVTVSLPTGAALDLAGNQNIPSSATIISDRTRPTPTITPNGGKVNSSPIVFSINFNEPVTGLTNSSFTITGGSLGSLSGNGASYSVAVIPAAEGTVSLTLLAGQASDSVGNTNLVTTVSVGYDVTAPGLTITPNGTITTANPISFTFTFTEPVIGFDVSDILITNGTKGSFSGSGSVYSLLVTPSTDGQVSATVGISACNDAAGNGNQFATATVTSDRTTPSVVISPNTGGTNTNPITFSLTFSELVTGLDTSDFIVSNGTLGTLAGNGLNYTVSVVPTAEGSVSLTLKAGSVTDQVGNVNAATTATVLYDVTKPILTITPQSGTTNASPITFTFTFNEPVVGFTSSDITVTNGTGGAFTNSGNTYTLAVAPLADGLVSVSVASFAVQDLGGNTNDAAAASVTSDRTGPSASITPSGVTIPTTPITFTITFNEGVFGFTQSDLVLTNGSISAFSGSGTAFTVNVTPAAEGPVTLTLPANTCTDAQGNLNSLRTATVNYDLPSDPILQLQGGTITYQRGDPAIILDATLAITDPDSPTSFDTGTLTVSLTNGGDTNDQISLTMGDVNGYRVALVGQTVRLKAILGGGTFGPEKIVATWSGGNSGQPFGLTFNREATPDRVNAILQSLSYSATNLIGNHETVTKTLGISFTDGTSGTNPAAGSMVVSVISPNRSPVALNAVTTTLEDTGVTGTLSTSWTDIDSPPSAITYETIGAAIHGTVTALNSQTGAFTFVPEVNYFGPATFEFRVHDESTTSGNATVTVTVAPVNDAPVFTPGANVIVIEDLGVFTATGWATGIGPGASNETSQVLAFTTTNDNPSLFTVAPSVSASGTLTFTSAPNANGSAVVSIALGDDGGTANGGVAQTAISTFTITVIPVNDPPAATPVVINTVLGGTWTGQVQITDPDGPIVVGSFTYQLTGISRLGELTLNTLTGGISFRPTTAGSESVNFTVTDGSSVITSSINIWVVDSGAARPLITSIPGTEVVATGDAWGYSLTVDPTSVAGSGVLTGYVGGISGATITKVTGNTFSVAIPSLLIANGERQKLTIIISDEVNHQADTQEFILVILPAPAAPN